MGSLNASGIPVVAKNSDTFRLRDGTKVYKTDSRDDSITEVAESSEVRVISSGSIVRDDGSVTYTEDRVWGVYMGGRSSDERVASAVGADRNLDVAKVDMSGVQTIAVIAESLVPHNAQKDVRHLGNKVTIQQSVGDTLIERVANSGAI